MASEDRQRKNPLGAPGVLLDVADGPAADTLAVVLRYIEDLPSEFRARYDQYFHSEDFVELRLLHSGLQKLRENAMPDPEELRLISDPNDKLQWMAEGFAKAARGAKIPLELEQFIHGNIVQPLRGLRGSLLSGAARTLVRTWYLHQTKGPVGEPPAEAPSP